MLDYFKDRSAIQDILTEAQTGLWIIELEEGKPPRLLADNSMLYLLGLDSEVSPEECYHVWYSRIESSYCTKVNAAVERVIGQNRAEVQYLWNHPSWGKIHVRCGGIKDQHYTKGIRIKGYHQNITHMITLEQEHNAVIRTLSEDYNGLYLCNVKDNTYKAVKIPEIFKSDSISYKTYDDFLNFYVDHVVFPDFREVVLSVASRESVQKQLEKGDFKNECIYRNITGGWRLIQIMPSREYSDDNPYVIIAFSDQNEEIEKRYTEAISQLAISRMYAIAVSINVDQTEYNCIHCSEDIMDLSHHGDFKDFHNKFYENIVSDDRKELEKIYNPDNYKAGGYIEGDIRMKDKQGSLHYYKYYGTRIMLDLGERILITLKNIDDRQKSDEVNEVLSNLCQCYYSVSLFHLEEDLEQAIWKEGFIENRNEFPMTNLTKGYEQFVKNFVDFRDKDKMRQAGSKAFLQSTLTEEQPVYDVDYRRIYPDGINWIRSRFSAAEMKDGKPTRVIFANMNIDEQKKKELEEREQIRQNFEYKNIIKGLSSFYHSVFYVDIIEGTYQAFTQRSDIEQYMYDLENYLELIQIYAEKLIHTEDQLNFIQELSPEQIRMRIDCGETIYSMEYRRDYGGYYGWMRMHVILAEQIYGVPAKIILAGHNIEQEKEEAAKSRQALQAAYEAATAANDAKSDFLAQMSHDIRTPMNAIVGMTAIAGASVSDPEKVMDCLNKIDISSKHLLTLISEMLDMSKIEKGKIVLAEDPFNLSNMVSELNIMLKPAVMDKNHVIQFQMEALEHEDLVGDAGRLRQVLLNLITNAIKYTPEGGSIQVITREDSSNLPGYGNFTFIVRDNGIGMSDEFLHHIFDPFERSEEAKLLNIQGTGLGLSIAKSISNIMQGDIKVKSQLGEGTEFTLTLFLKIAEEENCYLETDQQLMVLVVDDNREECHQTCSILKNIGLDTESAFSGEEALQKAEATSNNGSSYFAAIVDWELPGMDGAVTVEGLKKILGPEVPMFILTSHDWDHIEQKAVAAGASGFIPKPAHKLKLYRHFKALVEQNPTGHPAEDLERNPLEGAKVLLVEDNELNQEIAVELLNMAGAEVVVAPNGLIAMDIMKEAESYFQVILMDIRMPIMDGYTATRAIRSLNRDDTDKIPIIAMTANAFAEDVRAALDSGMNAHIAKPVDIDKITSVLKEYMRGRS